MEVEIRAINGTAHYTDKAGLLVEDHPRLTNLDDFELVTEIHLPQSPDSGTLAELMVKEIEPIRWVVDGLDSGRAHDSRRETEAREIVVGPIRQSVDLCRPTSTRPPHQQSRSPLYRPRRWGTTLTGSGTNPRRGKPFEWGSRHGSTIGPPGPPSTMTGSPPLSSG